MDSSLLLTSISMFRAELPGMLKLTVNAGKVCEGDSFTGSKGINAIPTNEMQMKVTINVKDDMFFVLSTIRVRV